MSLLLMFELVLCLRFSLPFSWPFALQSCNDIYKEILCRRMHFRFCFQLKYIKLCYQIKMDTDLISLEKRESISPHLYNTFQQNIVHRYKDQIPGWLTKKNLNPVWNCCSTLFWTRRMLPSKWMKFSMTTIFQTYARHWVSSNSLSWMGKFNRCLLRK